MIRGFFMFFDVLMKFELYMLFFYTIYKKTTYERIQGSNFKIKK
jgi:hypothetical protein